MHTACGERINFNTMKVRYSEMAYYSARIEGRDAIIR